jgi:stress-induced morphogen
MQQVIKQKLQALKPTFIELIDTSDGCGQSFELVIASPEFVGLNTLKRHRLVNSTLKEEIAKIHAFSCKCFTPEEHDSA